jgi:hypothetical protein
MNETDQVDLTKEFMLKIAATVTRSYASLLHQLATEDPEDAQELRRRTARMIARSTLEFASHLAASFASYEHETLEIIAQNTAAPQQQKTSGQAA